MIARTFPCPVRVDGRTWGNDLDVLDVFGEQMMYISRNTGLVSPNWFTIGCLQILSKSSIFLRKLTKSKSHYFHQGIYACLRYE